MKVCCNELLEAINSDGYLLGYDQVRRTVYFGLLDYVPALDEIAYNKGPIQKLVYCPFCGHKFQKSLWTRWYKELSRFGIESSFDENIPKEFLTDEWWKKRGL